MADVENSGGPVAYSLLRGFGALAVLDALAPLMYFVVRAVGTGMDQVCEWSPVLGADWSDMVRGERLEHD